MFCCVLRYCAVGLVPVKSFSCVRVSLFHYLNHDVSMFWSLVFDTKPDSATQTLSSVRSPGVIYNYLLT